MLRKREEKQGGSVLEWMQVKFYVCLLGGGGQGCRRKVSF